MGIQTSMHFYGWKAGLKTGMYYLRTRPAAQAIQFTIDTELLKEVKANQAKQNQSSAPAKIKPVSTDAPATAKPSPKANGVTNGSAKGASSTSNAIEEAILTPSTSATSSVSPSDSTVVSSIDERTAKAAAQDPEFAAALQRQRDREFEQAKLMCSIENKEACLMCSG